MIKMLTKQEVQEFMKLEGETRGVNLKIHLKGILEEKGEKLVKEIEDKMAELGCPVKYKELRSMDFYPIGVGVTLMLVIGAIQNLTDEEFEIGAASFLRFSPIEKIFMKYFSSLDLIAKQAPGMWRKHYTIGDLEAADSNEKERYTVLRLKNFKIHPIYCTVLKGYFAKVMELVTKSPVTVKENKCMFRGDEYHEFLIKW